jgi:2,4-dienoyl-CoA reductase-like NADH-dependent reductase (Old Yellow Enzyme family)
VLTTGEVERVITDFVAAALRAERAGLGGVQVHGAHGYLLGQFLNAERNLRTDGYGGSVENRFRIVHEVVARVRAATGPSFHVGLRLSPERYGIPLSEGVALAREVLVSGLLDHLELSLWDVFTAPHTDASPGLLIEQFVGLDRGTTHLGVAGGIASGKDAQWCLDAGVDFAARVVADPDFSADAPPYTRERLAAEHVGPAFVAYLDAGWDGFVVP